MLAMTSALWYYMTPQYPKPSAHDVITGMFEPTLIDSQFSIKNSFGTTIDIMAQDKHGLSKISMQESNNDEWTNECSGEEETL